jgi:hypothetical protein
MRLVPLFVIPFLSLPAVAETGQDSAKGEIEAAIAFSQTLEFNGVEHRMVSDAAAWLRRELLAEAARSTCADLRAVVAIRCEIDRIEYEGADNTLPHGVRKIVGKATAHARIVLDGDLEP